MLDRLVKVIYPLHNSKHQSNITKFSNFIDIPNIILLGDPGAGKSYLFEKGSQFEQGKLFSARNFLIYGDSLKINQIIYVDALDEKRSGNNDTQSIDSLAKMLMK